MKGQKTNKVPPRGLNERAGAQRSRFADSIVGIGSTSEFCQANVIGGFSVTKNGRLAVFYCQATVIGSVLFNPH
jgi:hypothetical protein